MLKKLRKPISRKCSFCQSGKGPNYKNPEALSQLLSDRGKILAQSRTGVCALHQRRLTREIKRARYLALLPFMVRTR